ncbi:MAG: mechanosensitive ion channel family protein [Pseudomonadota bacterium]
MFRRFLTVSLLILLLGNVSQWSASAQETSSDEATAEADGAAAYPAGLDDPNISLDALNLRVLPLTAEELSALSATWQGIAQESMNQVIGTQIQILDANGSEADALRRTAIDQTNERNAVFDRFGAVVSALESKGGDPAEVATYQSYLNVAAIQAAQTSDLQTLVLRTVDWLVSPEGGIQLATRILVVAASLYAIILVAKFIRGWVRRALNRTTSLSKLLQSFILRTIYWVTVAVGLMIVLSALGVNITPLFAVVGGASFIIAFAMQDTLSNLAAGLMIMVNRPFDEGDYVTLAGVSGTVSNVSVVSTTVTTPDNQVIVVPNSKVWGDVITNVTASDTRRVDMVFGIGYDDSIPHAQEVLEKVVKAHPAVLQDPEPMIEVSALGASSVDFVVRPWTKVEDYWTVYWDLHKEIKLAFDANGITIPYPQTEMTIKQAAPSGDQETPFKAD